MLQSISDWYNNKILLKLGYISLKDWQIELSETISEGGDVVLVAGTGSGKSALLHIPILVAKERKGQALVLSTAPTKTLADDQARAANAKGIQALAIHEDFLHLDVAEVPSRNLFKEVETGHWDLFIVSPEMLNHPKLLAVLQSAAFTKKISQVFVDECHLVYEHGSNFRPVYKSIGLLRARLSSKVPWTAVTATLQPGMVLDTVMKSLGFVEGDFTMKKLRIDNQNIQYISRFLRHSVSGYKFLDLQWVVPSIITSALQIPKTIIFCETIDCGWRVLEYLDLLLPVDFPDRARIILPFHSIMSGEFREDAVQCFRDGDTRIMIGSDCLTYGLDVSDVRDIVSRIDCLTHLIHSTIQDIRDIGNRKGTQDI